MNDLFNNHFGKEVLRNWTEELKSLQFPEVYKAIGEKYIGDHTNYLSIIQKAIKDLVLKKEQTWESFKRQFEKLLYYQILTQIVIQVKSENFEAAVHVPIAKKLSTPITPDEVRYQNLDIYNKITDEQKKVLLIEILEKKESDNHFATILEQFKSSILYAKMQKYKDLLEVLDTWHKSKPKPSRLHEDHKRKREDDQNESKRSQRDSNKKSSNQQTCQHCKKQGHSEESCWIKDPSKKPSPKPTHKERNAETTMANTTANATPQPSTNQKGKTPYPARKECAFCKKDSMNGIINLSPSYPFTINV
jgi:hypothetical protein